MSVTTAESDLRGQFSSADSMIEFSEITVDFGKTRALDRVNLSLQAGEIVGLVGANGAGKSTLARVLVGEIPYGRYSGKYRIFDDEMRFADTNAAHNQGVALVHQEGALVPQLSIGENVMLMNEPAQYGIIDWDRLHGEAASALDQIGLQIDTRSLVQDQGRIALMELAEVGRAIARGSRIFVFDESTSALGAEEIRILLEQMRELRDRGAVIIFVSHRLEEILSISDRIVVLRDGRVVLDAPREGQDHDTIVEAMIGHRKSGQARPSTQAKPETFGAEVPLLSLKNFSVRRSIECPISIRSVSLDLSPGEILGLYGPLGAGKTELLQAIYGLYPNDTSGQMFRSGKPIKIPPSPNDAISAGIAFVSSDRQHNGIVPQLSVLDNLLLGRHDLSFQKSAGLIDAKMEMDLSNEIIKKLGIKTTGPTQLISDLSGGNQQKVIIGRALLNKPSVLLLDEPTRGIDVGAKQDVYGLIRQTAEQGTAIVFSSMEEEEVIDISDRILILRDGKQVALVDSRECDPHSLLVQAGGAITQ